GGELRVLARGAQYLHGQRRHHLRQRTHQGEGGSAVATRPEVQDADLQIFPGGELLQGGRVQLCPRSRAAASEACTYAHSEEELSGAAESNFKTKMCLWHLQGQCVRGDACTFAHDESELMEPGALVPQGAQALPMPPVVPSLVPTPSKFKTQLCKFYLEGTCFKGDECSYAHGEDQLQAGGAPEGAPGEPLPMPPVVPSLVPSLVPTPSKFKTQICKFYLEGTCFKGDECSYAHGEDQLQAGPATGESSFKTKICVYHLQGKCFRGEACSYAHSEEELAPGAGGVGDAGPVGPESPNFKTKICVYYLQGKCFRGEACSYAHSEEELAPGAEPSFKTKMCNFYLQGQCVKGGACKFAHGELAMPPPPRALPAGTNGNRYGIIVPSLARKGG
ncbi:unnamed protein product, partial [Effrenium voratum]